jgi:Ca-activated chloride channel homolog
VSFMRFGLALLFSAFISLSAHAEGQRVILVLDASGSMWGKIKGKAKMDIAKEVVGKVISTWKPEDDLGLVVYGHREKGSCTDIETVWPPRPLNAAEFMSPIKALSPKGKTPMTQAVRQAAEALKYTEQKGTVILVSDGLETCDADPCAVAAELEKAGIGFTVHTVGFGLDDKAAIDQLKCMAEQTGGIAVLADDADELETALKQTVEAAAPPPEPTPPPAPEPVITKDFKGHVLMAEGVELPKPFDQVVWVFNTSLDGAAGEYLSTEYGNDVSIDLAKDGKLLAEITSDLTKIEVPFEHGAGQKSELVVNLNAGIVQFTGMMDENTPLPQDGPVWTYSKLDGTYYGTAYGATPKNLFVAGDYKLKLEQGAASIEVTFTVVPGKVTEIVVPLGAGIANVNVTYDGTQPVVDGTTIELRRPADISGAKEHVATEYGNDRQFKAAAGPYVIIATIGIAKAELPLEVLSGKAVDLKVNLNAGVLNVKAPGASIIQVFTGEKDLSGNRTLLFNDYKDEINLPANVGSYHVIALGPSDVVLGEKDVAVELGKRAEVAVP